MDGAFQFNAFLAKQVPGIQFSLMPAMLANDGQEVIVGRIGLSNPADEGVSAIHIAHLVFRAADRNIV